MVIAKVKDFKIRGSIVGDKAFKVSEDYFELKPRETFTVNVVLENTDQVGNYFEKYFVTAYDDRGCCKTIQVSNKGNLLM